MKDFFVSPQWSVGDRLVRCSASVCEFGTIFSSEIGGSIGVKLAGGSIMFGLQSSLQGLGWYVVRQC